VRLLAAHHRASHVQRARELLPHGTVIGIPAEHIDRFRLDLSEPPEKSLQAVHKLSESGKRLSAEIAARMQVEDYPESKAAQDCLNRVLGTVQAH